MYTTAGALHDAFSLPAFTGLAAASLVYGRRFARCGQNGWAAYSVITGVVVRVGFVLSSIGFDQTEPLARSRSAAATDRRHRLGLADRARTSPAPARPGECHLRTNGSGECGPLMHAGLWWHGPPVVPGKLLT